MKPYNQYGAETRRVLRNMWNRYPQPYAVHASVRDKYEALQRDGWVEPIGKRSVKLTDKGAAKMREVIR